MGDVFQGLSLPLFPPRPCWSTILHQGALRAQYRDDELIVQRFEQCLSEDVLADTIPDRELPFTGGPSLPIGGGLLLLGAAAVLAGRIIRR